MLLVVSLDVLGGLGRCEVFLIKLVLINLFLELVSVRLQSGELLLVLIIIEIIEVLVRGVKETTDVDLT